MPRKLAGIVFVLTTLAWMIGGPAFGQSDTSINTDIQNAGRRSLSQDALRRHHGQGANSFGATGPSVTLNIDFPDRQTGLANIEVVMLVPERSDAHECQALAQKKGRNRLLSLFIPNKDVRPNHSYVVVVLDARGDKYAVGRILVSAGRAQEFTLNAPLLTPKSPQYRGP